MKVMNRNNTWGRTKSRILVTRNSSPFDLLKEEEEVIEIGKEHKEEVTRVSSGLELIMVNS